MNKVSVAISPRKPAQDKAVTAMQRRQVASLHCLFSYDNRLGGAVHAALNVCRYLAEAGQQVESVASFVADDDVGYLEDVYAGFPRHRVPRSLPHRYFNAAALGPWLEQNLGRFDVVDLHGVFVLTTARAARVCHRLDKPYFVHSHGALDPFDLQKHALLKRFLGPLYTRPLLQQAAGVICTTQLEADMLVTGGASPRRCVVPLPVPSVAGSSVAGAAFRAQHGIPEDALVVLFMSRVDYKKGLEFLVPALAATKRKQPRLWFVLAGSGEPDFVAGIRRLVRQHGMEQWTTETGFISGAAKQGAFSAANLFALPSLNENFGIVLVEAMSAGLPLLVSNQVYIHDEVVAAGAGVRCEPAVGSCADALSTLIQNPEKLRVMGQLAQALAAERFSVGGATTKLLDIYAAALR